MLAQQFDQTQFNQVTHRLSLAFYPFHRNRHAAGHAVDDARHGAIQPPAHHHHRICHRCPRHNPPAWVLDQMQINRDHRQFSKPLVKRFGQT